jgi:hypothetical protein
MNIRSHSWFFSDNNVYHIQMELSSALTLFIALLQKVLAYINHLLDKYRKTPCHLWVYPLSSQIGPSGLISK